MLFISHSDLVALACKASSKYYHSNYFLDANFFKIDFACNCFPRSCDAHTDGPHSSVRDPNALIPHIIDMWFLCFLITTLKCYNNQAATAINYQHDDDGCRILQHPTFTCAHMQMNNRQKCRFMLLDFLLFHAFFRGDLEATNKCTIIESISLARSLALV